MKRNALWYTRMFLLGFWMAFATVFHFLTIFPFGRRSQNNGDFIKLIFPIAKRILGITYIYRNQQAPSGGPFVYIMNHQSALDILSVLNIYPKNCIVVVKAALTLIPFFGWILALGDNVFLDRKNRQQSLGQMARAKHKMLFKKLSVWIFPEGTRRNDGQLHHFKRGAFHLAIQTSAPIVPVVVSSYAESINFSKWKSGTVIVEVLPKIVSNAAEPDSVEKLMTQSHALMSNVFFKNSAESLLLSSVSIKNSSSS